MDALLNDAPASLRGRHRLLVVALAPVIPQLLGSAFNIWYNVAVVDPLLMTAPLKARFLETVIAYNSVCYPLGVFLWLRLIFSLRPAMRRISAGEAIEPVRCRREKRDRRKRVDPTTFEKQYTVEEIEFMNAMQQFKMQSGKAFPSHGDTLRIAIAMGYRQID